MKISAVVLAVFASLASAGVVIVPVTEDMVVQKIAGDCFFGVATPAGCAPLRKS
ncbi:hypothetical protein F5Y16DRAFT_396785 [Xylariaceae sp. FL0255]|nr:hypothetical protein F5Y16DRAFT_396785 [Xylariaceae sp. FL0255]